MTQLLSDSQSAELHFSDIQPGTPQRKRCRKRDAGWLTSRPEAVRSCYGLLHRLLPAVPAETVAAAR